MYKKYVTFAFKISCSLNLLEIELFLTFSNVFVVHVFCFKRVNVCDVFLHDCTLFIMTHTNHVKIKTQPSCRVLLKRFLYEVLNLILNIEICNINSHKLGDMI